MPSCVPGVLQAGQLVAVCQLLNQRFPGAGLVRLLQQSLRLGRALHQGLI